MDPKRTGNRKLSPTQQQLNQVIFGWETPAGKLFDVVLLIVILISIVFVMLESVSSYNDKHHELFKVAEWVITIFFTIEYGLRLYCSPRPRKYAGSFFGIIDFISILPAYLSLVVTGTHFLAIIRSLRLLRAFKIFELSRYTSQGFFLIRALTQSVAKIIVFLVFILIFTSIIGAIMYVIEGGIPGSGFDSIPRSVYWAIVTLTTVGYGDIAPISALGQFLAAIVMILGYSVIAVPTGIVSAEMVKEAQGETKKDRKRCKYCTAKGHYHKAKYCYRCGQDL